MKKNKSTKRALLMSILSLVMCVSMLVGSTFAWFTDTVTSSGNKIQAGTLDIALELLEKNEDGTTTWTPITESEEAIFDYDKWEPGYTDVKILKVANEGTLALKWYAKFRAEEALSDLAKVIDVYVCPSETSELTYPTDRSLEGYTKVGTLDQFINTISTTTNGTLLAKGAENNADVAYLGLALKMQEEAGNEYQGINLGGAFDIQIFATQYTYESDSFDNQYDKGASWTGTLNTDWYNTTETEFVLSSPEELAGLAQIVNGGTDTFSGKTVKLGANIDLNDIAWTPIGSSADGWNSKFNGTFIGTGYTISNLYVTGTKGLGLFGYVGNAAHIEGVTIDGAYVAGNDYVGAVMGTGYLAANCLKNNTVKNAIIIAMPYLMDDGVTYDGGAKAGAVAGYAINGNISGNKVIDCEITAYRDLGGIVGMAAGENRNITASDNSVEDLTLTYVNALPYAEGKVNENMGSFVGRLGGEATVGTNNAETNVTRETEVTYTIDGITYTKNVDENVVTLYEVTDSYANETVTVPEGVTTIGDWSFSGTTNVKTVIMPSSLTRIARKAFDGSSVEKVVLNEGLTEIEKEAFSKATNLKEINFPSTLTTIGYQAFRLAGFEALTIPATVTNIGEGAFRDLPNLTTVTIEGSPVIANYAFRSCANLTSVYLKGENVTFSGTSQAFCKSDNGANMNTVTFYVANQDVADKLAVAQSSAKGYNVVIASFVSNADELATAVASGATNLVLADGEYNVYGCGGKTLSIYGSEKAVLKVMNEGEDGCDYGFGPGESGIGNITFNGVTIDTTANTGSYKGYAYMGGTFNDCSFVGAYSLNNANTFVFNRCTFDFKNGYFWTWSANEVTFNNCIFGGNSKNILAHGYASTVININSCKFAATEKGYASGGTVWTAAVEIDPAGTNTYTINFTGENTINENYADWTRVKDGSTGHTITGLN